MEPIAVIGQLHALDDPDGGLTDGLGVCESTITWINHAEEKQFVLNHVVGVGESPTCVVGSDMVAAAAAGVNTAVLAIGQQGSGKSSTLFSTDGLIAFVVKGLLDEGCSVSLSLVEIYGDVATDVLHGKPQAFRPQYHPLIGGYGPDVARIDVADTVVLSQVLQLAIRAMAIDAIATNKTTTKSSRVVTLHVTSRDGNWWSRVDFADIAAPGNTRTPLVAGDVGYRLEQGPMNFAECAKLLADDLPLDKVPLQGSSSLVTLLSHTLGGRCKTFVIAHVIQSALHNEENLGTLRLAILLRGIQNPVAPNAYSADYIVSQVEEDLHQLRDHLSQVKRQLSRESKSLHHDSLELDHQNTRAKIKTLESLIQDFQKPALARTDDWLKFKRRVDNDETKLGSKVLAGDRTVHHLHLVRLHDDRLFSGVIGYHVAAADSIMSRDRAADIVLFGGGTSVSATHCELQVPVPGTVEVVVGALGGLCLINGLPLAAGAPPRALVHGDTLTCGRRNVFRVVIPDAAKDPLDDDSNQRSRTCNHAWLDRGAVLQTYRHPLAVALTHEDAQRRCHVALASILERIASIRTMFAQSVVDVDDENDVHDVMLQRGSAPPPKYMATRVRPETIKRLSAAAIADMNALESRIYARDTMRLLDAIDEFAAMCQEMCTPLDVHAVPMVNHAVTTNDDDPIDRAQLSTDIWVVLENPSNARERVILRPADFEIRLALLRAQFHQQKPPTSVKNGAVAASPRVAPAGGDGDPLQLASTEERIGVARVHLGKLAYYFDVDDALPIVSDGGQVVGHLMVQIQPHVAQKETGAHRKDVVKYVHHVNHDVDKEEELREAIGMGVTVAYRVNVRGARGLPPQVTSNVFVEYVFFEDNVAHATAPSACRSRHPVIEQAFMHHVLVTEEFCQYVATGALEFQVFGYRGDHVVAGPQKKRDEMYWMEMEAKAMLSVVKSLQEKVGSLEGKLHKQDDDLRHCRARIEQARPQANDAKDEDMPPADVEEKQREDESEEKEEGDVVGRRRRKFDVKLAGVMGKGLKDIRSGVCQVM